MCPNVQTLVMPRNLDPGLRRDDESGGAAFTGQAGHIVYTTRRTARSATTLHSRLRGNHEVTTTQLARTPPLLDLGGGRRPGPSRIRTSRTHRRVANASA